MEHLKQGQDHSEAMKYVKSLRDAVKRRYALTYLEWLRAGRTGIAPIRGSLTGPKIKFINERIEERV
jgi:hypothetical protein